MTIRALTKDEVEVKAKTCTEKGAMFLIYKTARTDMAVLDEVFGPMNWRNHYETIKDHLYCTIEVYDEKTNQWVGKCDCGTESDTEAEKGEASDAFKRAGFRWGIGRELYTAPFIWIPDCTEARGNKYVTKREYNDLEVTGFEVTDGRITLLEISLKGKPVYSYKERKAANTKVREDQGFTLKQASATVTNVNPLADEVKGLADQLSEEASVNFYAFVGKAYGGRDLYHLEDKALLTLKDQLERKLNKKGGE